MASFYMPAKRCTMSRRRETVGLVAILLIIALFFASCEPSASELEELKFTVAQLESKVSSLQSRVFDLESKVDDLESQVSDLDGRVSDLEAR
jgi:peptidoglycan hydrolase CwlO-like protein